MPFRAYYWTPSGELRSNLAEQEVNEAYASGEGLLWVDIYETVEADGDFLERVFRFHPLAIEDCVTPFVQRPKIDDFQEYLFIVVHGINYTLEEDIPRTTEIDLFLGRRFVVTNHNYPLHSIDTVRRLVEQDARLMRRGADFLAHAIIDTLVDNVMPTIDQLGDVADDIEVGAIWKPQPSVLEAILKLKRSTLRLNRVMAPQRELMNRLSRSEFPQVSETAGIFYRDIYDDLVRIEDMNRSIGDRADNALATYMSAVANRQNETMKLLAVIATIFMPLTFIAGIYGMNFDNMPELEWSWGYFVALGAMAFIAFSISAAMWARNWYAWGRRGASRIRPLVVQPEKMVGHVSTQLGRLASFKWLGL